MSLPRPDAIEQHKTCTPIKKKLLMALMFTHYLISKTFPASLVDIHRMDVNQLTYDNVCRGVGIRMSAPLYTAPSLAGLLPEMVFPQNLPSILCARVLDPRPGETVLDMCAAPGEFQKNVTLFCVRCFGR